MDPWQKGAYKRKEKTHHQDRTEEYIEGADASTVCGGTYKHNTSYKYCNHLVEAEGRRQQKGRDKSLG